MATMNISVPDVMHEWVENRVESGSYASASDYVRDLIRRDQAQTNEREALIVALVRGEESGVSPRKLPEIVAALKARSSGAKG